MGIFHRIEDGCFGWGDETRKYHCSCIPQWHYAAHDGTYSLHGWRHECECTCRSDLYGMPVIQENN